jgi:hypothetical protein
MRTNYFTKLIKYMKNVYHIERGNDKLSDGRKNPKYKTAQVIIPIPDVHLMLSLVSKRLIR